MSQNEDAKTEALKELEKIQTHLSEILTDRETEPEKKLRDLAQLDLDLESVALEVGRSPKFFSLKALVANARGDVNGSVLSALQGALLSIAVDSIEGALKEGGELKLRGPSALWSNMAITLSKVNLDMSVGAGILATHLDPEDETAKDILGALISQVSERSKASRENSED